MLNETKHAIPQSDMVIAFARAHQLRGEATRYFYLALRRWVRSLISHSSVK